MGFGIGGLGDAFKSAVQSVSDAVGTAAKAVEGGAEQVAGAVRSAVDGATGHDGFDDGAPMGPIADSKPKGGTRRTADSGGDTQVA